MSADRPYVAGVDTSTQSCKVLIVDPATNQIIREGSAPHPAGTEVDPEAWWQAFLQAQEAAGGLDDVAAISVGGQQHGMVCLDENGQVIRPALLWNDTRSAGAARDLICEAGQGDEATGKLWWAQATGSVPVASITITKLRWLAENEPENAARIRAICLPHDWLSWKISGAASLDTLFTDRSDASGTGYLDRVAGTYRREILAQGLKISRQQAEEIILPRVLGPWEVGAHGDPARGWREILIGPGCGDNAGAALGTDLQPGQALLSLGTSGVVSAVSEQPVLDASGIVTGFMDATGNWLPLACTLNASRIIDAMAQVLGVDYETFDRLALSVEDAGGLRLEPYFEGERTPNLPEATATLSGMTLANSRPEYVARASVEGLLDLMRYALDAMRALGVPLRKVSVVGGGAKSAAVQQLAVRALDAEVVFPPAGQYVALGAAKQAAQVLHQARD